jgi:hypothetical protein
MRYSGTGGKLIHEKNLKSKISCQCPFKGKKIRYLFKVLCSLLRPVLDRPDKINVDCSYYRLPIAGDKRVITVTIPGMSRIKHAYTILN